MMNNKIAKIQALADDQEFIAKVTYAETKDEMISVMAAYGVEMSADELKAFLDQVYMVPTGDELNEDMLDNVSGGGRVWNWIKKCLNNWFNRQSEKNANAIGDIINNL